MLGSYRKGFIHECFCRQVQGEFSTKDLFVYAGINSVDFGSLFKPFSWMLTDLHPYFLLNQVLKIRVGH